MLKKVPDARIRFDTEEDRRERWISQQIRDEAAQRDVQLRREAEAMEAVREATREALETKGGPGALHALDKRKKKLEERAHELAEKRGSTLWSSWLIAAERDVWGITTYRDLPRFPAKDALAREFFPKLPDDYVKHEKAAKRAFEQGKWQANGRNREGHQAGRAAFQPLLDRYGLKPFVGKNSTTLKRKFRAVEPSLRVEALGEEISGGADEQSLRSYLTKQWDLDPVIRSEFLREPPVLFVNEEVHELWRIFHETDLHGAKLLERDGEQYFWWYEGDIYTTVENLQADEVKALVDEKEIRKQARIAKAKDLVAIETDGDSAGNDANRKPIPEAVRHSVWRRDQGKCVNCGSNEELEFDHIIPLAMGGSNTERNLQLLCAPCNRAKGASLG